MFQTSIDAQEGIKTSLDTFSAIQTVLENELETGKAMREYGKEKQKDTCELVKPNPILFPICVLFHMLLGGLGFFWHFATLVVKDIISYTVTGLDIAYEDFSLPNYYNQFERFNWIADSMSNINWNIGHQHTQIVKDLQDRHTTMVNVVNAFTNCRVELHGYDVTRDVNGTSAEELLLQADSDLGRTGQLSCKCLIYPTSLLNPDNKCDVASRRRLGLPEPDSIKVGTTGNQHGEKTHRLITENGQKTMKELSKVLNIMVEQERLILGQEDAIQETMLNIALAVTAIQTKLDMEPTIPNTNVNNEKSKKPKAKKPKAVKDDAGEGRDMFKRNLLETGDVGTKACNDEIVGKFDTVEKEIKKIEGTVDMVKNDVAAMKEMVTLMMMQNEELIRQNKELIDQNHELMMNA